MIGLETKVYIRETRWSVRCAIVYVLVGNAVILNLSITVKEFYDWFLFYLNIGKVIVQVLFGVLLLFYIPDLDPYPGCSLLEDESMDDNPGEEQVFPEKHTDLFSKITFGWMNPIMQLGYKRPLTEKDVWKLDTWDKTETLHRFFLILRFWWAGFWKVPPQMVWSVGLRSYLEVVLVAKSIRSTKNKFYPFVGASIAAKSRGKL